MDNPRIVNMKARPTVVEYFREHIGCEMIGDSVRVSLEDLEVASGLLAGRENSIASAVEDIHLCRRNLDPVFTISPID